MAGHNTHEHLHLRAAISGLHRRQMKNGTRHRPQPWQGSSVRPKSDQGGQSVALTYVAYLDVSHSSNHHHLLITVLRDREEVAATGAKKSPHTHALHKTNSTRRCTDTRTMHMYKHAHIQKPPSGRCQEGASRKTSNAYGTISGKSQPLARK